MMMASGWIIVTQRCGVIRAHATRRRGNPRRSAGHGHAGIPAKGGADVRRGVGITSPAYEGSLLDGPVAEGLVEELQEACVALGCDGMHLVGVRFEDEGVDTRQ